MVVCPVCEFETVVMWTDDKGAWAGLCVHCGQEFSELPKEGFKPVAEMVTLRVRIERWAEIIDWRFIRPITTRGRYYLLNKPIWRLRMWAHLLKYRISRKPDPWDDIPF